MSQFFISYATSDQPWAEWIAWQIEKEGHKVIIQAWDFSPGSNFVLKMQEACTSSDLTIVVLSNEYLKKGFTTSEWTAAFAMDPIGQSRILIPVRVDNVKPKGLLSTIVYIDLLNITDEKIAAKKLLKGVLKGRGKPMEAPVFPQNLNNNHKPCYPGMPTKKSERHEDYPQETEIEIRINQDFEKFSSFEKEKILKAISELLSIDYDIKVSKVKRGSVLMTIKLHKKDALKLFILNFIGKLGKLSSYEVVSIVLHGFDGMTIDYILAEYNKLEDYPPVAGEKETGKIVFIDHDNRYGIIQRYLGGYLKFFVPEHRGSIEIGNKVSFNIGRDKSDCFFPSKKAQQ